MVVKYLEMTFTTESGDKATLSVNGIKENLTGEEVGAAMDVIIAKNAFSTKGGDLKRKYGAQVVARNVDEFQVV